jgi:NAD(P)-dependent dehydrogenase (short-subunit alcohol dehydrogenase family)
MSNKKKIIAITGGAGRIGKNLCKFLIGQGHKVIIGDLSIRKLKQIRKEVNSLNVQIFCGDLTKDVVIDRFVKYGIKKFKKIDVLVHCLYPKTKDWGIDFENVKPKSLNINISKQLGGTIILCQKIIKYFLKKRKGNLILISSILGIQNPKFEHYKNTNLSSPIEYCAIKAGIISITKYLAKYYSNRNLKINCISPGGILDGHNKKFQSNYRNSCNSKGLLDPKDIVNSIDFMISEKSQYIHGQNLIIDDGWSL